MKHTEQQIIEISQKVLKDIDGKYYRESCISKVTFHKDDELDFPTKKTIDTWVISIDSLFDNRDFLIISDETGEPLYYQNFNYITREIGKDSEGNYYRIRD